MIAFTFGAVLWMAVLVLLAWRAMTAVERERDGLAWLSVAAMVVVMVAGLVYAWQVGEVAS